MMKESFLFAKQLEQKSSSSQKELNQYRQGGLTEIPVSPARSEVSQVWLIYIDHSFLLYGLQNLRWSLARIINQSTIITYKAVGKEFPARLLDSRGWDNSKMILSSWTLGRATWMQSETPKVT